MDADRLSWDEVTRACACLAFDITCGDALPSVIAGVSRGGLIPAVIVAHQLSLRDVRTVCLARTKTDEVNAAKVPVPADNCPGSLGALDGMSVLVVDDVAGSGTTLAAAARLAKDAGAARVSTAACVVNDANRVGGALPDHVAIHVTRWVIFPWGVS